MSTSAKASQLQTQLFKSGAICTCSQTRKLARRMTQIYDAALASANLTVSQYMLLNQLKGSAPQSQTQLATAVEMDRTSLLRGLRPLEAAGLIATRNAGKGRALAITLTPIGLARLKVAQPLWAAIEEQVQSTLGSAEHRELTVAMQLALTQLNTTFVGSPK